MSISLTSDELRFVLRQIASLRLAGKSWSEVGEELRLPKGAVEQLVADYEALYWKYLRRARNEYLEVCYTQAVKTLHELSQSADEKIRHSAANSLLRLWQARLRYQSACQRAVGKKAATPKATTTSANLPPSPPATSAGHLNASSSNRQKGEVATLDQKVEARKGIETEQIGKMSKPLLPI